MTSRPRRIAFAGTPSFAATILARLLAAGEDICLVLTQPDRPAGRGRKLRPSPVKALATEAGLPLQQPASLRDAAAVAELAAKAPDVLVVAAYGLILPATVLDLPAAGCLNVHASLLPRWRGAAPVERAIMAGDEETGVCIMQMDVGLDTGPVRLTRRLPIGPTMTGGELEAELAELGASALLQVLADPAGHPPEPQPETGVCYAHKLQREDSVADFDTDAATLARRIRALNPGKPVAVTADGVRMQLLRARDRNDGSTAAPGTITVAANGEILIACGGGHLELLEARVLRGKSTVMDASTLLRTQGDLLTPGQRLVAA